MCIDLEYLESSCVLNRNVSARCTAGPEDSVIECACAIDRFTRPVVSVQLCSSGCSVAVSLRLLMQRSSFNRNRKTRGERFHAN